MTDESAPAAQPPAEPSRPAKPTRRLDARSLRGLAHPLRMEILEVLGLDGPATATGLAERLGENTGTVSWHLRHLAEHGFIEEETGRGTKRERWWRRARVTNELHTADFRDDPDTRGALSVFVHELVQQHFNRVMTYVNEDWDEAWRGAGTIADWRELRLTPVQLTALNAELAAVVARHSAGGGAGAEAAAGGASGETAGRSASPSASGSGEGTAVGGTGSWGEGASSTGGGASGSAAAVAADAAGEEGGALPVVVQLQSFPRRDRRRA